MSSLEKSSNGFPGRQIIAQVKNDFEKEPPRKPGIFTAFSKPPPPINGFKTFTEQVAGHLKVQENPCFMLDDDGHILKLLDKNTKLVYMEQEFYETLYNKEPDNEEWAELKKFVPKFHGTVELIHNERYLCYLKMDNLIRHYERPCIMDLKIGKITYDPFSDPAKVQRELIRYDYQAQLGFRITGFKVFKAKTCETELYDRFHCKRFKPHDMIPTFCYFFDLDNFPERKVIVSEVLRKLKQLLNWFEGQKRIKFFCTSLLIAYDGNLETKKNTKNTAYEIKETFEKMSLDSDFKRNVSKDGTKGKLERVSIKNNFERIVSKTLEKKDIYQIDDTALIGKTFKHMDVNYIDEFKDFKNGGKLEDDLCELMNHEVLDVSPDVTVNMIDFTHTFFDLEGMKDCVDENYMFGLRTLISELEQCLS